LKDQSSGTQSINRALSILEAFPIHGPEIGLSTLSRLLGINKTTTYRIIKTLEANGYISRSPISRNYRLGANVLELGAYYQAKLDIRNSSLPYLKSLSKKTGQASFLCVRSIHDAICIDYVPVDTNQDYFALKIGGRQPLHCGGASRAFLMDMQEEELAAYANETGLPSLTPRSITSLDQLLEDVNISRRQGFVFSDEDVTTGIAAIGVPVFDYSRKIVAAISISGIAQVLRDNLEELSSETINAARSISESMGYSR